MPREQMIRDAEAAECLAQIVSYSKDKERLLAQAARLRQEAKRLEEERTWKPSPRR